MISWSSFLGDDGGPGSFVRQQVDALELNPSAYPMYSFLRTNGFSAEDIVAIAGRRRRGISSAPTSSIPRTRATR